MDTGYLCTLSIFIVCQLQGAKTFWGYWTLHVLSLHTAIVIAFIKNSAHDVFDFDNSVYLVMAI